MAVDADHGLVDVGNPVDEGLDHGAHMLRRRVSDRVGNVDRGRAGGDRRFDDLAQKVPLGPRGVLRRELDVVAVTGRPFDPGDRAGDDLLAGHLQLELAVDRARRQEHVDPRRLRGLEGFPRAIDVDVAAAGQTADRGPADLRFGAKWFETFRGNGEGVTFDAWRSALPPPLSPLLMRGRPLNGEARLRAGQSQRFIDELDAWQPTEQPGS